MRLRNFFQGNTLKRFFWRSRGIWMTTPSIAVLVFLFRSTGLLQPWEWAMYDAYMQLRPSELRDERIAIVGINEDDVYNLQQSIISDEILAKLIEKIKLQQPVAIGLDMYRDVPVPPGSQQLNEVLETTPNLIGIKKVAGQKGEETVAPHPILEKNQQIAANDLIFDGDNRIRRGLIYLSDDQGNTVYSLSIYLALLYLQPKGIPLEVIEGTDNLKLDKTVLIPLETNDGSYVRTDAGGFQLLINYRGEKGHFETVSMRDILEEKVPKDWAKDRIILIGKTGESFKDLYFTPYRGHFLAIPQATPGVEIHANLTSEIINAVLEKRVLMRTTTELKEFLWILLWSAIGSVISWQFRYTEGRKSRILLRWSSIILAGGAIFITTYYAFIGGWWVPVVPALLAFTGAGIVITSYIARTAGEIRKTFGRYLTRQVVENLLENPSGQDLGGVRRKITILTSDLRGFTAYAERLSPEDVVKMLNFYFAVMADIITQYEGTIDEFMGDGILVLFGAPISRTDDPQRAIACALEMQQAMKKINQQMEAWKLPTLEMGIGINTGEVVVGNIGSEKRAKYGVVGAQVNLTYRIESYTTGGQILISDSTFNAVKPDLLIEEAKEVQMKGIAQPITLYEVRGIRGTFNLMLEQQAEYYVTLPEAIALQYQMLDGKQVQQTIHYGRLLKLSEKTGIIGFNPDFEPLPSPLTNLKVNFLTPHQTPPIGEDIYGKVLEKKSPEGTFILYFTSKTPHTTQYLAKLYHHSLQQQKTNSNNAEEN